jgi:hypothetical protein
MSSCKIVKGFLGTFDSAFRLVKDGLLSARCARWFHMFFWSQLDYCLPDLVHGRRRIVTDAKGLRDQLQCSELTSAVVYIVEPVSEDETGVVPGDGYIIESDFALLASPLG